jgi:hypothetical protein
MTPTGHHPAPAWFDISSPAAPRAQRFYQETFGWPVNLLDQTHALFSSEGDQPASGIGQAGSRQPLYRDRRHPAADDQEHPYTRRPDCSAPGAAMATTPRQETG